MPAHIKIFFILLVFIFSVVPAFSQDAGLVKLAHGEDMWLAVHYLLQAQAFVSNIYDRDAGESSGDAVWSPDFQLRRSRFILNGQVTNNIEFFMQTDDILVGSEKKPGDGQDNRTYTQDAYISYKLSKAFGIDGGLMPVPFMHHNLESAVSLLGVDYNAAVIPLRGSTTVYRDTGLQIRAFVQKALEFRLGVFRGQSRDMGTADDNDDINPNGIPRFTGRLQFNFADPEDGFFYSGNYLGRKTVIAFGGGIDFQPDATRVEGKLNHYLAWTGDLTVDYKVSDNLVGILQGAYVKANNAPEEDTKPAIESQWGFFVQAGALLYGTVQPVVRYQYWKGNADFSNDDSADNTDINVSYLTMGLNYFVKGHNANIKFEYQHPMGSDNKSVSGEKKATLQGQIFI